MGFFDRIKDFGREAFLWAVMKLKEIRFRDVGMVGVAGTAALSGVACSTSPAPQEKLIREDAVTKAGRVDLPPEIIGGRAKMSEKLTPPIEKGQYMGLSIRQNVAGGFGLLFYTPADPAQQNAFCPPQKPPSIPHAQTCLKEDAPTVFDMKLEKGGAGEEVHLVGAGLLPGDKNGKIYVNSPRIVVHIIPGEQKNIVDISQGESGSPSPVIFDFPGSDVSRTRDVLRQARDNLKKIVMYDDGKDRTVYLNVDGEDKQLLILPAEGTLGIKFHPLEKDYTRIDLTRPDYAAQILRARDLAIERYSVRGQIGDVKMEGEKEKALLKGLDLSQAQQGEPGNPKMWVMDVSSPAGKGRVL